MAPPAPFAIRGSHFNMVTLQLREGSPDIVLPALQQLLTQSPAFLKDAPVVLGLDDLAKKGISADFSGLIEGLRVLKLIPVGAAGGNAMLRQAAAAAGLAQLTKGQQLFEPKSAPDATETVEATETAATPTPAALPAETAPDQAPADLPAVESAPAIEVTQEESPVQTVRPTVLVTRPVRAGSRIYAQGRDVICTATVNAGAEVIADGHVHVYGTLRGRAIAGASGFDGARIFALNFDPELVSIAGLYRVREHLDAAMIGGRVQVSLDGEEMKLDSLG